MRISPTPGKTLDRRAFNLVEVTVLVATLSILALWGFPALVQAKDKQRRIRCVSHLKQIGLSFRLFATDHQERFPMKVTTNQGGSFEHIMLGDVYWHYRVMSNELGTSKILQCPDDKPEKATVFTTLTNNSQVSYFVGLDAEENSPELLLCGDHHISGLIPSSNRVFLLETTRTIGWSGKLHRGLGQVALGDGSVQQTTSDLLRSCVSRAPARQRLAMP
ncbi:MAG TPA: type II secretion system protein [Candidatus Paceibacterota bacterium]|nr:type II secretion system protein [Candidatus Paceibacterota bacterium]HSA00158.1 type II secretion system protein [Candidatus Paceibacterota bacterium]